MTRILIVDDHPKKYEALVSGIGRPSLTGNDIVVASNLRDALNQLQGKQFDVLVLDMYLPGVPWGEPTEDGGSRLLEHLDEDEELKRPKYIIGVTASSDAHDVGSHTFESKPWVLVRTGGGANWESRLIELIQHAIDAEAAQDSTSYGIDICLLTALKDPEFVALAKSGIQLEEPMVMDDSTFIQKGLLTAAGRNLTVVAAHCRRMGSTESALLTAKLIQRYRPRILGMTGICAGFNGKVDMGDVIVASPAYDYMMSSRITVDAHGKRTVTHAPDFMEVPPEVSARFDNLSGDAEFLTRVHAGWPADKPKTVPQIYVAPSASGPAVVADNDVFEEIRKQQHRATVGLEMEAYGVYSAVRMSTRPRPLFFCAKAVCDHASFLKDDKYQKYAAYTSASVVSEFLRRFGAELCDL